MNKDFIDSVKRKYFQLHHLKYIKGKHRPLSNFYSMPQADIIRQFHFQKKSQKLVFATQVGRGGGKWVSDILNAHENIRAYGERNRNEESIYRYCKSYDLKINYDNFYNMLMVEALEDWKDNYISYISSPYFSFGIQEMVQKMDPDFFVILLNDKYRSLNSFYNKGWFSESTKFSFDGSKPPFPVFQGSLEVNHFFGRYINFNLSSDEFNSKSRIEKIGYYLQCSMDSIYSMVTSSKDKTKFISIYLPHVDQNYKFYSNLTNVFSLQEALSEKKFLQFKKRTSAKFENLGAQLNSNDQVKFENITSRWNDQVSDLRKKMIDL
jgi:hypothetical protein